MSYRKVKKRDRDYRKAIERHETPYRYRGKQLLGFGKNARSRLLNTGRKAKKTLFTVKKRKHHRRRRLF